MKAQTDYEKGQDAYIDGDVKAYVNGSTELKEGYRDRFNESLSDRYDDFHQEIYWDQHYFDEIEPAMKAQEAKQRLHASVAALVISALTIGVLIGHVATVAGGVR